MLPAAWKAGDTPQSLSPETPLFRTVLRRVLFQVETH